MRAGDVARCAHSLAAFCQTPRDFLHDDYPQTSSMLRLSTPAYILSLFHDELPGKKQSNVCPNRRDWGLRSDNDTPTLSDRSLARFRRSLEKVLREKQTTCPLDTCELSHYHITK